MVQDSSGATYFADGSNQVIRKLTSNGTVTTVAGAMGQSGLVDGPVSSARFSLPWGIARDAAGNLYVSEIGNNTIRKITPSGQVSTLAGSPGQSGSFDGRGATATFNHPSGLVLDAFGNLLVADENNHTIRKVTPNGTVSTFAGSPNSPGATDGNGGAARFCYPTALALGPSGALYVADSYNFAVRKISPSGQVSTLTGQANSPGDADGPTISAQFNVLSGIVCDASETIYVTTESGTIRKITPDGTVSTVAGIPHSYGHRDGVKAVAGFEDLNAIALGSFGTLLVSDATCIRSVSQAGDVLTLAGSTGTSGSWDGAGTSARFSNPEGMAMSNSGDLFVSDRGETIRRIAPSGVVTTVAGTPGWNGIRDGLGPEAVFSLPTAMTFTPSGDLLIVDTGNSVIRKMSPEGQVSVFAGYPMIEGSTDSTGLFARFAGPMGILSDLAGNLLVADTRNHTIRKVTPLAEVSTWTGVAGTPGHADGTLATATFEWPRQLKVDSFGNIFVADSVEGKIRKISSSGQVSTIGSRLLGAQALACDASGNVYVVRYGPLAIDKIAPTGEASRLLSQNTLDELAPGKFPSSVVQIRDLLIDAGYLYVLADNSVLKVGPLP
jgi:sugar lactone lactonase YvrE